MKKLLLALAFAVSAQVCSFAQGYSVTTTTGTYADLTGATVVSYPGWTPDTTFIIPIGFNFVLDGTTFTSAETNGFGDLIFTSGTTDKYIFGFDAIVLDKAALTPNPTATLSPISYLLSGTAGSRILKIEYKNTAVYTQPAQQGGQGSINPSDVANFQIWLYEGSNKVEVHYGTVSTANVQGVFYGEDGPSVAIVTDLSTSVSGFFLQGLASAPTVAVLNQSATYMGLTGVPASGTIYAFNRVLSGVAKDLNKANVSVYPNPATDVLHVNGLPASQEAASVKIYDVLGKVVLSETLAASQSVNISALKNGTYFMEITAGENRIGKNIIKQ